MFWYKIDKYDETDVDKYPLKMDERFRPQNSSSKSVISTLTILNTREEDTGVYFCKADTTWGPGTEIRVVSKFP